jgi:FemAB-related protein (PEP-CTERM system-associated)
MAVRDGVITGVLPLVRMASWLFGRSLVATPFCVYGGPLAADEQSLHLLLAHAAAMLDQSDCSWLELRCRDRLALPDGWVSGPDLYVTFRKPIEADHDRNMKAIPRKQRAMVRKAIQNGLTSVSDRDVGVLHRIYAESVRNLGTPVFPRRYFHLLMDAFGSDADIVTVFDKQKPVASVMNFYFRNEVLPYYGGGIASARTLAANDFMYWEVMRNAAERGCTLFDFGRSKRGTGAFAFKHNWGFPDQPLHYMFRLKPGVQRPDHNPANPTYALFIKAWKALPLPLANLLGPFIVRGVG